MTTLSNLNRRFLNLQKKRAPWESTWADCYRLALPQQETSFLGTPADSANTLFDGTAPDCVDQLSASIFSELTPPWVRWFDLSLGDEVPDDELAAMNEGLEAISDTLNRHFNRSNFSVELHQCYLDLVTVGTACLLMEENKIGEKSAFRFTAVPLNEIYLDEGPTGRLDVVFRKTNMTLEEIAARYPNQTLDFEKKKRENPDRTLSVIEAVVPASKGGYDCTVFVQNDADHLFSDKEQFILDKGHFDQTPFIVFRWLKAAGEIYGRSPVMKALPDIKTANKVVELILKNASIAVTGIWQAEDDGVLNPMNIRLEPGEIIPKAVGSKGLTPLEPAGNFDVSQLVLADLRSRIKHALLTDKLGQVESTQMTATEVLERSAEMIRILGATYGRLQSELLNPLIDRGLSILRRRGQIPDVFVDGQLVKVSYKSPIARMQQQTEAGNALSLISSLIGYGAENKAYVNMDAFVPWLASRLNVPLSLINCKGETDDDG